MNSNNPLNFRVAAFQVLRYADQEMFKGVTQHFEKSLPNISAHAQMFLKVIESGDVNFQGVKYFDLIK